MFRRAVSAVFLSFVALLIAPLCTAAAIAPLCNRKHLVANQAQTDGSGRNGVEVERLDGLSHVGSQPTFPF